MHATAVDPNDDAHDDAHDGTIDAPSDAQPATPAVGALDPRTWRLSLVALGIIVAAGRWWFSSNRRIFHMAPDEPAQLAMARWLSGGPDWNLFDHNTWRPGMAVLLAPLYWLTEDPTQIVRGALMITAALGGVAAIQLASLGRQLTDLSRRACLVAAGAIALAPSSLAATAFVWAEGLVTVTFLATLAALLRDFERGRAIDGLAALAIAAIGFASHSRMLPLFVVVAVLVIGRRLVRRQWRLATVFAAAGAAAVGLVAGFSWWVFDTLWDDPAGSNTIGTVIRRLPRITDNLASILGQTWYQLASTAGLALIGFVVLVTASVRRGEHARTARLVVATTLPLVLVSMIFMSGRTRSDHRIYGRYNDAVLWPVLIVAIAWLAALWAHPRRRVAIAVVVATVAATFAAGFGVRAVHGEAIESSVGVRPMVSGLLPVMGSRGGVPIMTLTTASAIAAIVLAGAGLRRRGGRAALTMLAITFVIVGGTRTHAAVNLRLNSWLVAMKVTAVDQLIPPDATIGVRFMRDRDNPVVSWDDQRRRAQLYQFALPGHRFVRDTSIDDDVGPYVFAPANEPSLESSGATIVWTDPAVEFALWREAEPKNP